jgi:hypothetical protein
MNPSNPAPSTYEDDSIDFAELFGRLKRQLPLIVGLAALGLAIGAVGYFTSAQYGEQIISTRVVFSFPGFEKGEYPDKSKFQVDDLRSPEIIAEALKRKGFATNAAVQSNVRAGISVQGLIPDNIVKERDKLRASGQTLRLYVPDEYTLSLALPRSASLTTAQRESLLREIATVYQERFVRTYISLPLSFGKAFESLADSDYLDYEIVLSQENQNIGAFLTQMNEQAKAYRSPRTNLSFSDLLKQAQFFSQIRLNETLGLIRENGLSLDRKLALLKFDYYLKTLSEDADRAAEEEKVVQALLKQSQERMQNYVLGIKSQTGAQRSDGTVIDQGLVDSLLANDANNFLVRESLKASLKTRRIQADKAILLDRRKNITDFIAAGGAQKTEVLEQFQKSLNKLKETYDKLVEDTRLTYQDYQQQYYGNAVQISMQPITASFYRGLAVAGAAGMGTGMALGLGLALLGLAAGKKE